MHGPIPASYWVVPGLLLAGEYAGAGTPARARPKLEALLDAGIRAFFDLTEEGELPPYEDLLRDLAHDRGLSVAYDRVPIRDAGVPHPADLYRLLSLLETNVDRGTPSYVHCWGGIGRTGTVVGCWLVEHSTLEGEALLNHLAELRFGRPDGNWRSPETDEQAALVVGWAEIRRSLGTVEPAGSRKRTGAGQHHSEPSTRGRDGHQVDGTREETHREAPAERQVRRSRRR